MMRTITGLLFLVCLLSVVALGASDSKKIQGPSPVHPDTSAPDAWGYTWVKSTEAGGPTFRWVDISTRGTLVTGLADDNVVGPFDIRFNFPYYWYTANRFKVGSNGYITFDNTTTAFAPAFAQCPNTSAPNDLMAICVGDLIFSGQTGAAGQCYYWTNGTDSLVVSFINVTEWETTVVPANTHTFQVILNRADSSITYQYGLQRGRYNTTNNTRLCIGMENATGQIGLNYVYSIAPPHALLPDSGLAIKIKRTVNTGLQVTDAGIVGGLNASNIAKMVRVGVADTVKCVVKNFGTAAVTNAPVRYAITKTAQPSAFDTVIVASLAVGQEVTVTFPRLFTPAVTGPYAALFNVTVPSDVGPGNNNKTAEITSASFAVGSSTLLAHESGTLSGNISWTGGGGFGVAFDLPPSAYPVRIETVFVSLAAITAQPMIVQILDGSSGSPGTVLASKSVTAVVGMNAVNFTGDSVRISGGRFFIGATGQLNFNYETTSPISYRTWEYTGGWAPYRTGDLQDVIMRCTVRPYTPAGTTYNVPEILYLKFKGGPTTTPNYAVPGRGSSVATITGHTIAPGGQFDSTLLGTEGTGATNWVDNGWAPNLGSGSWTIGFWVSGLHLPTTAINACYLFGDVNTAAFRCFWAGAGVGPTDTAILLRKTGLTDVRLVLPNPSLGQSSFVHFVYDSSTATIKGYRNGVLSVTGTWAAPAITGAGPFKIAGYSTAANSLVSGAKMDEFRVYSRALDSIEITRTWNQTLPYTTTTGVKQIPSEVPNGYVLAQNYPNPFNPSTTIRYALPLSARVNLSIYNVLGQRIAELTNELQSPGSYAAEWNGRNQTGTQVSTGVYFYQLEARPLDGSSPFNSFKKMLLLK